MIDDAQKTDLLIARLKECLPIAANISEYLAGALKESAPDLAIPKKSNVINVFYTGDMGGILCHLDIGGADSKTPFIVSITNLTFDRRLGLPLSREIEAYQRHRIKKLKQQQGRGN